MFTPHLAYTKRTVAALRNAGKRFVLMVPGHNFFPGLDKPWPHTHQCMRMNYVPEPEKIEAGVKILAEEIERAWAESH